MKKSLIISSLIYKYVERFAAKLFGFVISIILARLLAPEAFGQIAIINVFVNLSQCIVEGGLGTALVQNKTADDTDYSTVFYICVAMSVVITAFVYIIAPLVADYYDTPELLWPLRFYAFTVFVGSYSAVLTAKIQREMRFKQMMVCNLVGIVLAGIIAVILAMSNAGIWTLVIYYFGYNTFSCAAMAIAVRWIPKLSFSMERAKELYGFGWKMLVSTLLKTLYNNIRPLIIGKRFSTTDLGYYDRGDQIPLVITHALDISMSSVMLPVMSQSQSNKDELRGILRRAVTLNAMLVFPAMGGLAMIAEPFIRVFLTDKWLPSVVYMQILCIANASIAVSTPNGLAVSAQGRSDIYMKFEFIRRSIMLVQLILTVIIFDSVLAIAYSYAISVWLDTIICTVPNKKLLNYGFVEQLKDLWKIFLATGVMALLVWLAGHFVSNLLIKMLLQLVCGGVSYVVIGFVLKIEGFSYIMKILKNRKEA